MQSSGSVNRVGWGAGGRVRCGALILLSRITILLRMVAVSAPAQQIHTARLRSSDGVHLAVDLIGESGHPPVVFAHGLGQTRHAWRATASTLAAQGFHCTAFDARGHGDSEHSSIGNYAVPQLLDDLHCVAGHAGSAPLLVGASMGGLLGLAAQADAGLFSALVLVDVTPRLEASGVARITAFMQAHADGFESLEQAAAAIAAYLPHREARSSERLRKLLVPDGKGRWRWHWDPRFLDRMVADGDQHEARLLDAAARIDVPVLLVTGGASDVVSAATIEEFRTLVRHAEHVVVPGARHMVAGDANDVFSGHVSRFAHTVTRGGYVPPILQGATP